MSELEKRRLLRGCFESLGRLLAEFSQFPRMSAERLRQIIEYDQRGLADLREAEKDGRAVIFLTGHLGAWEVLSFGWSVPSIFAVVASASVIAAVSIYTMGKFRP